MSKVAEDKLIWYIDDDEDIYSFLCEYFSLNPIDLSPSSQEGNDRLKLYSRSAYILKDIMMGIPRPFTVVRELNHIDRSHSEGYYSYYSNKHIKQNRFCERLSFFYSKISLVQFCNEENHKRLQECLIGCCVIRPTMKNEIGHTLLDPQKVKSSGLLQSNMQSQDWSIRLSEFEVHIRGVQFYVTAFPFRMQDAELTTCAEVTLINLLEYFGKKYDDYRNLHIEEIVQILQSSSSERVLPSHGLAYNQMTKILSEAGFSPRVYSGPVFQNNQSDIKDILFYYIESGLPVGIGLFEHADLSDKWLIGHSMVCIGYTRQYIRPNIGIETRLEGRPFYYYNAADYFNEYIMMDDNEAPYCIKCFSDKEFFNKNTELNILVPLYKRMFMEATDAYAIATSVVMHSPIRFDAVVGEEYQYMGQKDNPLVFRLFLASSKRYKASKMRLKSNDYDYIKAVLGDLPLPRFIWVCELYRKQDYEDWLQKPDQPAIAYGEVIIDATANPSTPKESILMVHYPGHIAYRFPDQDWDSTIAEIGTMTVLDWKPFPGYTQNLTHLVKS